MKKITLLFLLLSISTSAKFFDATIIYTDGTKKSGLIDIPYPGDSEIKFKISKESKAEKIKSDLLSSIIITYKNGSIEKLMYVYPAQEKKKGIDKEKKKYWLISIYDGKINFLALENKGNVGIGFPGINYYIHIPENDYALYFNTKHAGLVKVVGEVKLYKKLIAWHFKDLCPSLVVKSESGEIETKDMNELIELYKKTCE